MRPTLDHDIAIEGASMANTDTTHERQLSVATYNTDHGAQGPGDATFCAIYGSIGFDLDPRTQLAFPFASNLEFVFPTYLSSAIIKVNSKAWLKVSFAEDPAKCE